MVCHCIHPIRQDVATSEVCTSRAAGHAKVCVTVLAGAKRSGIVLLMMLVVMSGKEPANATMATVAMRKEKVD